MAAFGFLPFPDAIRKGRTLDPTHDFSEGPFGSAFLANGALVVASELFYNARRYDEPAQNHVHITYVTRFSPDLSAVSLHVCDDVMRALEESSSSASISAFTRTPADELWFMTREGQSYITDERGALVHAFANAGDDDEMLRGNFACLADVFADGRLVVVVAELKAGWSGNIIAISEEKNVALARAQTQPTLRYLTSLDAAPHRTPHPIEYVRLKSGAPFSETKRPAPTLADRKTSSFSGAYLRQVCPVGADRVVVVVGQAQATVRSPSDFIVLDDEGRAKASLDLDGDNPYDGGHLRVVALGDRIVWKSSTRLHVFDRNGKALRRLALDGEAEDIASLHLEQATPDGGLLFFDLKKRTLLRTDPLGDDPGAALAAAARFAKNAYAEAKKKHKPTKNRWLDTGL